MTNRKTLQMLSDDQTITYIIKKGAKPKLKENKNKDEIFGSGSEFYSNEDNGMKKLKLPNINSVERSVLQCIIGQDEPARQIITSIYKSIIFKEIASNLLIIGKSGTGKTETIKQILSRLHIPYTIEDATKYTQEGYYGADVEEMVFHLFENAGEDLELAQNGVIVIDEIDKKASQSISGERDVSGVEVLNSLLKIIEGSNVVVEGDKEPYVFNFDTSNLIIIFMGAFSGIDKIRDERLNVHQVGFSTEGDKRLSKKSAITKQDLVKYGFPEEFVGRIGTIVEMNELGVNELVSILKNSKLSIFRRYQKELRQRGIYLSYSGKLFEDIAKKSLLLDTGARELTNTVNYIFEGIMYEILSDLEKYGRRKRVKFYRKCFLCKGIIDDNTKYIISNKKYMS